MYQVISRSQKHRRQVYADIAKHLPAWKEKVIKEKAIYDSMNKFNYDVGRKCLIAEGWCPKNATEKVVGALRVATESSGALVPSIMTVIKSREEPPTYFKTNKFTRVR
jgi:V-type H+-transporting ATPase subunit a